MKSVVHPKRAARTVALIILGAAVGVPALAGGTPFSGTRSNVSLGGTPFGRCGPALTVSFAPDALSAGGSTNLGDFTYTGSHCIAGFPPGPYTDGQFTWDFGNGTLVGTYAGMLTLAATPGAFDVSEAIVFTGGSGRFQGATGSASAAGSLRFGMVDSTPVSFGDVHFSGTLDIAPIPEPSTMALLLAGLGTMAMRVRRAGGLARRLPRRGD